MTKLSKFASEIAKLRWKQIPKRERAQHVPTNGGRPRLYPKCKLYRAHRFGRSGTCPCGYVKPENARAE